MNKHERLAQARQRLESLVADPFGGLIIRDLVPRGHLAEVALAEESVIDAVRRCVRHTQLPAVIAVDEPNMDALTVLIVHHGDRPGTVRLEWPGAHRPINAPIDDTMTLAEVIRIMRQAHDNPQED